MSFVDDVDVTSTMEILVAAMAKEFSGEALQLPLPRLEYHDVMERFGSDRPDLRYSMELKDVASIATCVTPCPASNRAASASTP